MKLNVLARRDTVEALDKSRIDFQSRIGRAFPSLTRRVGALLESGMYIPDGEIRIEAIFLSVAALGVFM